MKFLLIFLLVMLVAWRWRAGRSHAIRAKQHQAARNAAAPQDMVRCDHCGLHLPQNDAVPGQHGTYCSTAHRQKAEP